MKKESSGPLRVQGERLSESVYQKLVELILVGELAPGEPVSELALTRRLEVSRTPVHEAIKQLVKDGLMAQAANRRPVVVSFDEEDIFDIYEMRRILEGEAAAKAAQRIDRKTLENLSRDLSSFQFDASDDVTIRRWAEMDGRFHATIANASGSQRLADDINRYRQLHQVFNRTHTDVSVLTQAVREHAAILAALESHDRDAARHAMQVHLQEWQRFFMNHLRS